jgi:hypothetical protein
MTSARTAPTDGLTPGQHLELHERRLLGDGRGERQRRRRSLLLSSHSAPTPTPAEAAVGGGAPRRKPRVVYGVVSRSIILRPAPTAAASHAPV